MQVIDASDVVLEVLDARDPLGFRCPQLEEAVLQREGDKKLVLVLNKIGESIYIIILKYNLRLGLKTFLGFCDVDLVPEENVQKWVKCLQAEFPVVAFKASILPNTNKVVGDAFLLHIMNLFVRLLRIKLMIWFKTKILILLLG